MANSNIVVSVSEAESNQSGEIQVNSSDIISLTYLQYGSAIPYNFALNYNGILSESSTSQADRALGNISVTMTNVAGGDIHTS